MNATCETPRDPRGQVSRTLSKADDKPWLLSAIRQRCLDDLRAPIFSEDVRISAGRRFRLATYLGQVSVVRRDTYRRWGILGVAIACLCALPTVVAALPVHAARIAPADLRAKVLAAADHPYQGYVQSDSTLNVPDLPQLGSLSSLLGGTTTIRTWFADQ